MAMINLKVIPSAANRQTPALALELAQVARSCANGKQWLRAAYNAQSHTQFNLLTGTRSGALLAQKRAAVLVACIILNKEA